MDHPLWTYQITVRSICVDFTARELHKHIRCYLIWYKVWSYQLVKVGEASWWRKKESLHDRFCLKPIVVCYFLQVLYDKVIFVDIPLFHRICMILIINLCLMFYFPIWVTIFCVTIKWVKKPHILTLKEDPEPISKGWPLFATPFQQDYPNTATG